MDTQEWSNTNNLDDNGNPAGGHFEVLTKQGQELMRGVWQDGPLGRGENRMEPNGVFVETMLQITRNRIEFYQAAQDGKFACPENAEAIACIDKAQKAMSSRTARREAAGVEGTHEGK